MRPGARWVTRAQHDGNRWLVAAPEPWHADRHMDLLRHPGDAAVVLGIDVPIGVPRPWARRASVLHFREVLDRMSDGTWPDFTTPAETPDEISVERPFYPRAPGGTSRVQLVAALGLASHGDLLRECDSGLPGAMPAAAPLFWLVGAQQVGRAALSAWSEVVAPLVARPHVRLWPMDGALPDLADAGAVVIAEAYPRAAYEWPLAMPGGRWSKRRQHDRAVRGARALAWADECEATVHIDDALEDMLRDGFGPAGSGEDPFDSVMGALQVIAVMEGLLPDMPPGLGEETRAIEGWILGRPA